MIWPVQKTGLPYNIVRFPNGPQDGRVQNMQILESTATQEVERKVINKMKNEWRYEKGKPRMDLRIIATLRPLKR